MHESIVGISHRNDERISEFAARTVYNQLNDPVEVGISGSISSGRLDSKTVKQLEESDGIKYVEEDCIAEVSTNNINQIEPWGIKRTGAEEVHNNGVVGKGATVAVLDSGIDADHPDLNVATGRALIECNASDCTTDWDDNNGHGTHCAGTIGAEDNTEGVIGVAPAATLVAYKVMNREGRGRYSDIVRGVVKATDDGCDVLSMSIGGPRGSRAMKDAVRYAIKNDSVIIAASGNGGCTDCVNYPAKYDDVVAVSASTEQDEIANFVSKGPEVDVCAPGRDVLSTIPGGYKRFNGTSMATPHVAGAIALLLGEKGGGYTPNEAAVRLVETAVDIGAPEQAQGAGLIDLVAAVDSDEESDTPKNTDRKEYEISGTVTLTPTDSQ